MTTTDEAAIAARIDINYILDAADATAEWLTIDPAVVVGLAPGDSTLYQLVIVAPHVARFGEGFSTSEYIVTLTNRFGASYPWAGQEVDYGYAQAHWTAGGSASDPWTAVVMTKFLNALAHALTPHT